MLGFRLTGRAPEGTTATDVVLTITERLRKHGVVGKFVEFFGEGLGSLTVADRVTLGNMCPEYGATVAIFPIDDMTLDYLKTREQFGQLIGSFQALKHRAAREFIAIELCRSTVMAAARAVDAGDPEAAQLVSLAKAECSEAALLIANESIQMFGGIGMTDEHDIGFYLKRARAAEMSFGDSAWHRRRWAELSGY